MADNAERIAPVQGYPAGIPWSLHLEAYAVYCKKWGQQPALIDLDGRNCRGGFSTEELDEFIPGWREKVSELGRLRATLGRVQAEMEKLKISQELLHAACTEFVRKVEAGEARSVKSYAQMKEALRVSHEQG